MKAADFKDVRGKLTENASVADMTWFKAGGPADLLFKPADADDLQNFLAQLPDGYPVLALGVGSNVIIRDGGFHGAVIRLGREFNFVKIEGDKLAAGAATLDVNVANEAADAGLSGLSFMAGIPGTIGGAVRMNAGAYHGETKDHLQSIDVIINGERKTLKRDDIHMSYRHTDLPEDAIVLSATFGPLPKGEPDALHAEIKDIQERRAASQPIREKTGGSTFANPSESDLAKAGLPLDMKTWRLIDEAGGRGLRVGDAQMSEKHCNFLINTGAATAADIENLGEEVRRRVYNRFGVDLRWEIRRIGQP